MFAACSRFLGRRRVNARACTLASMPLTDERADPLLADLTDPQRHAVLHESGPLLILAAAGSGKTRVITRRIAHLVRRGVPPWSILALTFTNKAAAEMRGRVEALLGAEFAARGLTVTTFHALGARLLRRFGERAGVRGLRSDYSIYDTADQLALVKRTLATLDISPTNFVPRSMLDHISDAKSRLVDADGFARAASDFYFKTVAKIYTAYEEGLRAANAVDFDDLLLLTARMLAESAPVRDECRARWAHLLIDEYQDTNHAQFEIARLLAGGETVSPPNIAVVGDPDQSIYGWRGADIGNILEFEQRFPSTRVIALGENFRSTAPILGAADTLIRRNVRRKPKPLFTRKPGGEKVRAIRTRDEQHEAAMVVDWFRTLRTDQPDGRALAWREMAVLYRTNALSRVMEDALRSAGVPYVIARGTAFYQREEVKNALAYLRVVANPRDDVSLGRIVNTPPRGLGDTSLEQIAVFAGASRIGLFDGLRRAAGGGLPALSPRARAAAGRFVELFDGWTGAGSFLGAGVSGSLRDLAERVLDESGLRAMYEAQARASNLEADKERLENLDQVISSAAEFEAGYDPAADPAGDTPRESDAPAAPPLLAMLRAYLESVSLVADADLIDPEQGAVTLMTLHAAKGLEFPAVAIIGLEHGVLPHIRSTMPTSDDYEEERRLLFVGMTRAMRRLLLSTAALRIIRGRAERTMASPFLDEIGREHVAFTDLGGPLDDEDPRDEPERFAPPPSPADNPYARDYPVGSMVRHPRFGLGQVVSITGGNSPRAEIKFRDAGVKTIVFEYVRLVRVK